MAKRIAARNVPFKFHPRVFAALGKDLVTDDFVAITELVKNAYDAFASRVDVSFGIDEEQGGYIEIMDNGSGMNLDTLENVWCVVATPFRADAPTIEKGKSVRRVSGEKGLGRLSIARLGERLEMVTQAPNESCLKVSIEWALLSGAPDLDHCNVAIEEFEEPTPFRKSGTRIRVYGLFNEWDLDQIEELREHLSRLLSPFSGVDDFEIRLSANDAKAVPARIELPKFLQHPKYRISGNVDGDGKVVGTYTFKPVNSARAERRKTISVNWRDVIARPWCSLRLKSLSSPSCGPFAFEIRAWDIGTEDVHEIVGRFEMERRAEVRSAIRAHKGISVYRDGILVLPKSETARDWLGLDLRRVSEVGTRLSTSQIIGYVSISAESNPLIKDTSDRERLVDSIQVATFKALMKIVIEELERERTSDRLEKKTAEAPLRDLFSGLSADALVEQVQSLAKSEGSAKEAIPLISQFGRTLNENRHEIERRFVYYSRLATIGTIAAMLVHEVRNKTTVIGTLFQGILKILDELNESLRQKFTRANSALTGLDHLAETFAPLSSRSFGRGRRSSILEKQIQAALSLHDVQIRRLGIECKFTARTETHVAIDPGELDAVLLNLIDNAIYWLSDTSAGDRVIEIRLSRIQSGARVRVSIHDTGPGVSDEIAERIFWPGVTTKKPEGIGMGLTIASEIVDAHDGKMALQQPGELGGASFVFDLPIKHK